MDLLNDKNNCLWELKCCIYCYTNKVNNKKYVGQICRKAKTLKHRHNEHISNSYNTKRQHDYNMPFHNAIRKYGIENFTFEVLKVCNNSQECDYWEKYYIENLNTLSSNNNGYNLSSGGSNGNVFKGKTEEEIKEWKDKISKTLTGKMSGENNPFYGKKHTEETKEKMKKNHKKLEGKNSPLYGTHLSEERKQQMSEERKGANNYCAKKIIQYNKDMEIIKIWDYIKEASDSLNIAGTSISACCRGKRKTAGGFIWRYYEEVK